MVDGARVACTLAGPVGIVAVMFYGCNALWGLGDLRYDSSASAGAGGNATSSTVSSSTAGTSSGGLGGVGGVGLAGGGIGGIGGIGGAAPVDFCDEAGLVACYRFDGDTLDGSPNLNHATDSSGATYQEGISGQALYLSQDSNVTVPSDASFVVSQLTIEAWIRLAALPTGTDSALIFDHQAHYGFSVTPSGLRCAAGVTVDAPLSIDTAEWLHVACTADAQALRIYVNGELVMSAPGDALNQAGCSTLGIGQNVPDHDHEFQGRIDDLRIFNYPRSAAQICYVATGGTSC